MELRLLNLDGSLPPQRRVLSLGPEALDCRHWGPRIRLACSFGRFRAFRRFLSEALGGPTDARPRLTLYGSGDFHHVSLALLRRVPGPCNLLLLDKHPDWMGRLPFLHCGTWVAQALKLPQVRRVFHLGGDLDFDNAYRWLAPWASLHRRRVVVFPALRRFTRGAWPQVAHEPLRQEPGREVTRERLEELVGPYREDLASVPLYISVDKDVLTLADAVVNWDSGHLRLAEVDAILDAFCAAAGGRVAGMDLVGDWSAVKVRGWFRRLLHLFEHEALTVEPAQSTRRNEETNLALIAARTYHPQAIGGAFVQSAGLPSLRQVLPLAS
jgi:hypothetical protein